MAKQTLNGVSSSSLREILATANLLKEFDAGNSHCAFCGEVVSWENTFGVYLQRGELQFICDKFGCYDKVKEGALAK